MNKFDGIPQELKNGKYWVCWRLEKREEKEIKIPINPKTGGMASHNDPTTWTDFDTAREASKKFNGIGFVFYKKNAEDDARIKKEDEATISKEKDPKQKSALTAKLTAKLAARASTEENPYCGIDLDKCINGNISEKANEILQNFQSYAELSQSRKGFHILVKAKLPGNKGRKREGKEIYDTSRFFVMTGERLADMPKTIEERQKLAEQFWESLAETTKEPVLKNPSSPSNFSLPLSLCDDEIIEKAKSATNGAKFNSLWSGNWEGYSSQSEADLALCSLIAFYTQDLARIDGIFRRSGLNRPEWEENASKRTKTIKKALEGLTATYAPNQEKISIREEEIEAIPKKLDIPLSLLKIHPLFGAYLGEFEDKTEAPLEYILSSFLVSISGAIGNKVSIPSGLDSKIKPNLYMMLIGDSTFMKKTTSLFYGMSTLRKISDEKRKCFTQQKERSVQSGEGVPQQKTKDESFIYPDDLTFEQCVAKMHDKSDGVFVHSELGAFLARMESGQGVGFKEMLTSLYDGKAPYLRETKTSGCFLIENPAPSLIGASTFQWLQNHLKDGDLLSGFLGRFCYVVRRSYPQIDIPFQERFELKPVWRDRLEDIIKLELELKLSQEAKESFSSWYGPFKKSIQEEETFLHSPLGRLKDEICHKIAIINHVLDLIEPSLNQFIKDRNTIEKRSYELAYPWIEFFAKNVKSCYMELTQKLNFSEMKIIEAIKKKGKEANGFKTLAKSKILSLTNLKLKDFNDLIETLIAKKQVLATKKATKHGDYTHYSIKI